MKKRLFALLTAAFLLTPVLAGAFWCDTCDEEIPGVYSQRVKETGEKDGLKYTVIEYYCPKCNTVYGTDMQSENQVNSPDSPSTDNQSTDPTDPSSDQTSPSSNSTTPSDQSNDPPADNPPPVVSPEQPNTVTTSPEAVTSITNPPPVTPPVVGSETALPTDIPNITLPPAAADPTPPPAAEITLPPTIPTDTPVPVPDDLPTVTAAPATPKPAGSSGSSGSTGTPGRDYRKHPVFSAAFPSRRLNLPGDPEARAPRAGTKIWPIEENEAQSLLEKMLNAGQ